ncbi:MAG: vanadium-dependent haloperoxidase [Chloroflexota bacterium]
MTKLRADHGRRRVSRRRSLASISVAAAALLGVLGAYSVSAAPPSGTDASEVTHWNQVAATTLIVIPGPNGGAPPAFQINMGIVQGAVYDAVNAIGPKQHREYVLEERTGAKASVDAAVATAAYDVLSNLVSSAPERAPFPVRAALLTTLQTEYDTSLSAVADNAFKKQGISIGHLAAKAMLDARANDGRFGPSQWDQSTGVGKWQPMINPATSLPILDPTPWVGGVRPFLIQSSSQFRSAAPPALDSAQWAAEFNEVKSLGRATGSTRNDTTDQQTYKARWWQSAPGFSWNQVARQLIARNDLDAADAARLLALQNLSGADAAINCWNDKYHFDFWRPWNAIPRAADDGNDATEPDATWTPLISAPYPEWVSGHNCLDTSQVTVLRLFFGDTPGSFDITSTFVNPGGPAVRSFDTFSQALTELIEARIWAGLHYRSADVAGQLLGTNVANYAIANYFQAVGH